MNIMTLRLVELHYYGGALYIARALELRPAVLSGSTTRSGVFATVAYGKNVPREAKVAM